MSFRGTDMVKIATAWILSAEITEPRACPYRGSSCRRVLRHRARRNHFLASAGMWECMPCMVGGTLRTQGDLDIREKIESIAGEEIFFIDFVIFLGGAKTGNYLINIVGHNLDETSPNFPIGKLM